jgi:glycosyltransferase involved in cell wall biosynthesis
MLAERGLGVLQKFCRSRLEKNILIIARNCPFPATDGEKVRVYNIIKNLSKRYNLTLVYRAITEEEKKYIQHLQKYCYKVFAIYIPKPRNHLYRLRLVLKTWLMGYPLICAPNYFKEIHDFLSSKISNDFYDAIQIEHSLMFPYLDSVSCSKQCLKMLTVHNIDFLRFERLLVHMPFSLRRIFYSIYTVRLKKIELTSMHKFNFILTMSGNDSFLLEKNGFKGRTISIPNGVDTNSITPADSVITGKNIIFVGSLDYEANRDGVLWFVGKIWPEVTKAVPKARLTIVGKNPGNDILACQSEIISVTGSVKSVEPYYRQARVCIVPLRSGGGTRLKILEALAYGIPIVSTSIGCEGIQINQNNMIVADQPAQFVEGIKKLMLNDQQWQKISMNGRRLVEEKYSWKNIVKNYDKIL